MPDTSLVTTTRRDSLATVPKPKKRGHQGQRKLTGLRLRALKAYEDNFGNISATCAAVGIHRMTFYRWLESPSRINVKFREHLSRIRPEDRLADALETAHMRKVINKDEGGDVAAIIFGLKTKAKHRGWNEKELVTKVDDADQLEQIRAAIAKRAEEKGASYQDELRNFLGLLGATLVPALREKLEGEVI